MIKKSEKAKVVIVDDEYHILSGITRMINKTRNFEVSSSFQKGKEALGWISHNSVDFLISDIRMPELDGLQLSSKVAKLWPQIKIILLTGYADFDYVQQALKLGVFDYILKPCSSQEILNTLERASNNSLGELELSLNINVDTDNPWISTSLKYIVEHYNKDLSVEQIANHVYLSPSYFSTLFKESTGYTVNQCIHLVRIEKGKQLLASLEYKGYEIANIVGYKTFRHFNEVFKKFVGTTPSDYRKHLFK